MSQQSRLAVPWRYDNGAYARAHVSLPELTVAMESTMSSWEQECVFVPSSSKPFTVVRPMGANRQPSCSVALYPILDHHSIKVIMRSSYFYPPGREPPRKKWDALTPQEQQTAVEPSSVYMRVAFRDVDWRVLKAGQSKT